MRWFLIAALVTFFCSIAISQSNQDCFDCHDDNEMTMTKKGNEISLYVGPKDYQKSPHSDIECIDCHSGFDPYEEPHKENITAVNCAECHDDATLAFKNSSHAKKLNCKSCHGDVHKPQSKAQMGNCESCHKEEKKQLSVSIHAQNENGPGCADCHNPHEATAVSSAKCLSCHGQKEFVHENIVHEDLESIMHYSESIHGDVIECNDCHSGHEVYAVSSEKSRVNRKNIVNLCTTCHDDVKNEFLASEHGKALISNFDHAPTCTNCHGIRGDHYLDWKALGYKDDPIKKGVRKLNEE